MGTCLRPQGCSEHDCATMRNVAVGRCFQRCWNCTTSNVYDAVMMMMQGSAGQPGMLLVGRDWRGRSGRSTAVRVDLCGPSGAANRLRGSRTTDDSRCRNMFPRWWWRAERRPSRLARDGAHVKDTNLSRVSAGVSSRFFFGSSSAHGPDLVVSQNHPDPPASRAAFRGWPCMLPFPRDRRTQPKWSSPRTLAPRLRNDRSAPAQRMTRYLCGPGTRFR